jgi:hypothetical protein
MNALAAARARDAAPALERFAERALEGIAREHPYHLLHVVREASDVRAPRALTPMFFGCFDWHSAVHGHWCLARMLRCGVDEGLEERIVAALDRSFTGERAAGEAEYLGAPGREGFERPYGLAWLLQLLAELRESPSPRAFAWHRTLLPLESIARTRLVEWLPKLRWPIRSGEHSQTAFALGLALDWARSCGDLELERLIDDRARAWHSGDAAAPVAYEPSGHDFLSPILGEADLMRRVFARAEFAMWWERFSPPLDSDVARRWLTPVVSPDRADGKLAHLDGLNLSRAWMLDGIASALPEGPARHSLEVAAECHGRAGVDAAIASDHYAGTHWLGSFASYWLTRRGVGE